MRCDTFISIAYVKHSRQTWTQSTPIFTSIAQPLDLSWICIPSYHSTKNLNNINSVHLSHRHSFSNLHLARVLHLLVIHAFYRFLLYFVICVRFWVTFICVRSLFCLLFVDIIRFLSFIFNNNLDLV